MLSKLYLYMSNGPCRADTARRRAVPCRNLLGQYEPSCLEGRAWPSATGMVRGPNFMSCRSVKHAMSCRPMVHQTNNNSF